jgi:hypothetical protein
MRNRVRAIVLSRSGDYSERHQEGLFSALSAGFFLVLVGILFAITPNLFNNIVNFFRDINLVPVPNTGISLPAPLSPASHAAWYFAEMQFSFVFGLFQILVFALRFIFHSPLDRKAETAQNMVFWLGASYLIRTYLNENTTTTLWFVFWAALIVLIGFSLLARALVLAFKKK